MAYAEASAQSIDSAYAALQGAALSRTQGQDRPKAILLGGQPGSGKSILAAQALHEFRASGAAVVIDADRVREEIPGYKQLSRRDPQHAADRTHSQAAEWASRLTRAAI